MTDGGLATAPMANGSNGISRRRFVGYLIAAPTLVAAAQLTAEQAQAAVPTVQPVDLYDLSDLLTDAARPTSNLIAIVVNPDGTVSFAMPRARLLPVMFLTCNGPWRLRLAGPALNRRCCSWWRTCSTATASAPSSGCPRCTGRSWALAGGR